MLEFDEFKALLLDNDFRDVDDIASRVIFVSCSTSGSLFKLQRIIGSI